MFQYLNDRPLMIVLQLLEGWTCQSKRKDVKDEKTGHSMSGCALVQC